METADKWMTEKIHKHTKLTAKEQSEIIDLIFRCGEKVKTVAHSWVTGKPIEAFYFKADARKKIDHEGEILKNSIYKDADDFKRDFSEWVILGHKIIQFEQGEKIFTGNYKELKNMEADRSKIWERIAPVLRNTGLTEPPQKTETKTDKLTVPQIALIYIYEGIQITRENAGEIAAAHGYTAKKSGEGLFQDYTKYCSTANRKGKPTPCTPKKLKNKIKFFESVVNHLSDKNKQRAIDEIKILETIFENEF